MNVITIARRELGAFFHSMIAYVILAIFLLIAGVTFFRQLSVNPEATLEPMFYFLMMIFLFLGPVITMRLLSEELRSGTVEVLLTAPVTDTQVVLGKFVGVYVFFTVMVASTGFYWVVLEMLGAPDRGPILTGYLGVLLLGGYFLSFGLLASALTSNQIVAGFVGVIVLLLNYALGRFVDPEMVPVATTWQEKALKQFYAGVQYVSFEGHLNRF